MPFVPLSNAELYYEVRGAGRPLLLIAGLGSDSQSWLPAATPLSRTRQVVTFDNRGVGRTTPQDGPISIRGMADDALALLDHLGLSTVDVIGHSMGGFAALELAHRHAARVGRLVLAATVAHNGPRNVSLFRDWGATRGVLDPTTWYRGVFRWIFSPRFFEEEALVRGAIELAVEAPYPQSDAGFRRQVEALTGHDARPLLPEITTPTLVVCGREDLLTAPAESERQLGAIPGAQLVTIDGAAHAIHLENAPAFLEVVQRFFSR